MKQVAIYFFSLFFLILTAFAADQLSLPNQDDVLFLKKKVEPAGKKMFVVDTADEPLSSVDRISGHIDTGFSGEDSTYESKNHYRPGVYNPLE